MCEMNIILLLRGLQQTETSTIFVLNSGGGTDIFLVIKMSGLGRVEVFAVQMCTHASVVDVCELDKSYLNALVKTNRRRFSICRLSRVSPAIAKSTYQILLVFSHEDKRRNHATESRVAVEINSLWRPRTKL